MANTRLSVVMIREILRLHYEERRSLREIGQSVGRSPSVVHDCLGRFVATGLQWRQAVELEESELHRRMYRPGMPQAGKSFVEPDCEAIHKELCRKGVTLRLLWQEYRLAHPDDGYQYSHYCEQYRRWKRPLDAVLRRQHKAGEKVFVDWSGDGIAVTNRETGEVTQMPVFVAALGASGYAFIKAAESRQGPQWIRLHSEMVEFFGGVPAAIVPDNEKTAVRSACRYDPELNPTYAAWARHYGTAVLPARPYKPRDKAMVENAVLNAQRWILAALRNHTFFSLAEANEAIAQKLAEYNDRMFQKLPSTRRQLFESVDLPALRALPPRRFDYFDWSRPVVHIDYHVVVDRHRYSVPYRLIGKRVEVHYSSYTVEVLYNGNRVACHPRSYQPWGWSTDEQHRPEKHRAYLEWTPERIVRWAAQSGPKTAELASAILSSRRHPEHGYQACLGVMRLGKTYGIERLEAACDRALCLQSASYKTVAAILKNGADRLPPPQTSPADNLSLPFHGNIRGPDFYQ